MKKTLLMAAVAVCMAAPAFAMDASDADMKAMAEHCMKMGDANGDGMMSKEEMMAMSEKMFTDSDTNKDGMASLDEITAAHKKDMEEMKAGAAKEEGAAPEKH